MRPQHAGMGLTFALHALAVSVALSYAPARQALQAAAPIMIEFITPAKPEAMQSTALPKRPLARTMTPAMEPAPIVAAPVEAPAAVQSPGKETLGTELPAAAARGEPQGITPPVFSAGYLENPAPAYPALSRRLGEQGKAILRVLVNPAGAADEVQLQASSGHARLDDAARDTVRRWKFAPARRGAEPVAAWVLIPISFRLEG